ncbi:RidA family protein [Aminobacter sp. AP02]|uniref:RidA family protein n=1 Tax=Aminobacter sp. AP02 TaxID=2135737 RepID=UPI000D6DA29F|nr:RidA family protein [Aminobacter sp. AP02]PWK65680.1 enamine deaminase RidA (YjgF/YER057c/UK114 family) [Aminobacter sp. AP02]
MNDTKSALKHLLPQSIQPPLAAYSHGVAVAADCEMIFCSGQLGISSDGEISPDVAEQAERCFDNIRVILAEGGMSLADVVRINAFVTDRAYMKPYMSVRDRLFPDPAPASTLMIVSGFTREEFKVEIEVVAARSRMTHD